MTSEDKKAPFDLGTIASIGDLLQHAYAIEREAESRYLDLAYQLGAHNNGEAEAVFLKIAAIEGKHADEIEKRLRDLDVPARAPWQYLWSTRESPEAADPNDVHYLMTPYHILTIALNGEQNALAFYEMLKATAQTDDIRSLAAEFAEEEREHVRIVKELIAKLPAPPEGWDQDLDPPMSAD